MNIVTPMETVGADVEFFYTHSDSSAAPSEMVLPSKDKALCVHPEDSTPAVDPVYQIPQMSLHMDGIQGELTISPGVNLDVLVRRLRRGMMEAQYLGGLSGFEFSLETSIPTPEEVLSQASLEGWRFGCDPDFNAWEGGGPNRSAAGLDARHHYTRYAGCHVHLGAPAPTYTEKGKSLENPKYREQAVETITMMDVFLGVPLVLLEYDDPRVAERRKVFGRAGSFRYTSYGVEYRVPSTVLLRHPFLYEWAFEMARFSWGVVRAGKMMDVVNAVEGNSAAIINAINHNDAEMARWVLERVSTFVSNSSSSRYQTAFVNFVESGDISDFYEAWEMDEDFDGELRLASHYAGDTPRVYSEL